MPNTCSRTISNPSRPICIASHFALGSASTSTNFFAGLLQDIRYALRTMRNSPGFTAIAVLTFALGIGANTAIFTMMNGLMLHALPVRDPGSLVEILHHGSDEPEPGFNGFTWDAYEAMRDGNHVLSEMIIASLNFCVVSGHGLEPQTVSVSNIGGNFFESLGVKPAIGRLIGEQDIKDSSPVAVVSYSFWKSHLNSSPAIIGQKIIADDKPFTIIGVTQRGFYGISNQAKQDLWLPVLTVISLPIGRLAGTLETGRFDLTSARGVIDIIQIRRRPA